MTYECFYCMNKVEEEHGICEECQKYDCPECKDEPLMRMGADNMDMGFAPCSHCGRDGYDLGYTL